jgi:hypothetical protein
MALDHHNIGDDDVAAMRSHFTDAEFLEFAMMAGHWLRPPAGHAQARSGELPDLSDLTRRCSLRRRPAPSPS